MQDMINKLKKYRIGVLAGGCSRERDISLKSGKAVFETLKDAGLDVVFVEIQEETAGFMDGTGLDLVFLALHGGFGENGGVQRMLEEKGIPYTGSGPEASRLAFNKLLSKDVFKQAGISVPDSFLVENSDLPADARFPCVVKPCEEGSSMGFSVVSAGKGFAEALRKARSCACGVMVEEYIAGREITVAVLGDKALPVVEIITDDGVFDFEAKYKDADTRYVVPADIGEDISLRARETGLKAHRILGCGYFSRVDMRLDPSGRLYVLEVNTIPGFTERSLLPLAAEAAGMGFQELCLTILEEAVSR